MHLYGRILYIALLSAFWTGISSLYAQFRLTENLGQWDERILFRADMRGARLFVSKGEFTYLFYDAARLNHVQHHPGKNDSLSVHVLKLSFEGASPSARYTGEWPESYYHNYYKGSDSRRWKSRVKSYAKLYIHAIYPGIDFELFETEEGLKYNFIVWPGGDAGRIRLRYSGADSMHLQNGQLNIRHRFGLISELKPLVYEQGTGSGRKILPSSYVLNGQELGFEISGRPKRGNTLVIDPVLVFSSYSGSLADNFGYTATFDPGGQAYAGGTVFDFGFPTTVGAYQMGFAGGEEEAGSIGYLERDCGILKFAADGKSLLYATYLGGSRSNEQPHSMIVDRNKNLLIMGTTKSADFPIAGRQAFDDSHNGLSDIFIAKISEDGTALMASTFVGGSGFDGLNGDRPSSSTGPLLYNYADDFRGEIIVDSNGFVYVASSSSSSDFPMRSGFDMSRGGAQDGCVFSLNPDLSALLFSSFIGGDQDDAAYGLDFGTDNDLYVTGGSSSSSFGYNVPGIRQSNHGGRADGYLLRMDLNTLTLRAFTFIGTAAYDQTYFVKTDKYGKPFVFGQTEGVHGSSAGVYANAGGKMFLKKLALNCDAIEKETTFGALNKTRPDISPTALLVDECERIFISGWGGILFADEFPGGGTYNMPITSDAHQKNTDGYDFYLAVFGKDFSELQYASFFGGISSGRTEAHEHVDGGTSRFDPRGIIYQSVCAGCGSQSLFPSTPGVWSTRNRSGNCNNALFKFDFENLNRRPQVRDSLYSVTAGDTLSFEVRVSDPDLSDSLRVLFTGAPFDDPAFPGPAPVMVSQTRSTGANVLTSRFQWASQCAHEDLDTVRIRVQVYDRGCPAQDSNEAIVRIVVRKQPLSPTPETLCLFFRENGSVSISWKPFARNRYFRYVVLYRQNPNGSIRALDTLRNTGAGSFTDLPPGNPKAFNYQYFMIGYNLCMRPFDRGIRINTVKEFNTPIDSTYLHFATVKDKQFVHLNWFKSKEEDFGSYDVYRSENRDGKSVGFRKIKTIEGLNDTDFIDQQVDVNTRSYCYRIGVNDRCGHVSNPSNEACNIVLSGTAGHLYFDLDWLPYREWAGGVSHYELFRQVDTGSMRKTAATGLLRVYNDADLDLWWGAYYYVVKAHEGLNASGEGYGAVSLSNEIRLIQPPMVFVPNAFSPNGDGYNDVWGVSHAFVKDFRMMVFNRWGEKVWDNDFKGDQWDGTTRGRLAMNDVFVWIVTYRGWDQKFYTQKGTVTVMP